MVTDMKKDSIFIFEEIKKITDTNFYTQIYKCAEMYSDFYNEGKIEAADERKRDINYYFPNQFIKKENTIVLIAHELTRTGAPVVLADMAQKFVDDGYNVLVFSPTDGPLKDDFLMMGCIVIIQPALLKGRYSGEEILEEKEVSILSAAIVDAKVVVFITLVLHNVIKHFIGKEHTIFWWLHEGEVSFKACCDLVPKELSDNIKILCGGEYVRNQLDKFSLSNYKGEILNYGVEDISQTRKFSNIRDKRVTFICAATIDYRKGQDIFVEAIKQLSTKQLEKSKFIFIGTAHNRYVEKKVKKLSETFENVILLQEVSREELFDLYDECDSIVCTSRDDPMPVVLTENMCLGNICVVSDRTGTASYIEDYVNGYVFESENINQLVDRLGFIIDNIENLDNVRRKSRLIYETYFTEHVFRDNVDLLMKKYS